MVLCCVFGDDMINELVVILLSVIPISELRGAIPTGIALGMNPLIVFIVAVIFNSLVFFPIYFGLEFFYERLRKNNFMHKQIERIRKKGHKQMEKYGIWGLIPFVAIPLPLTGAWTGTIIAWLFDIEWWKSFIVISIGVTIAGVIVTLSTIGVLNIIW